MVKRYSKLHPPIFEELEPRLLFSADIAQALAIDAVEQDFEEPVVAADLEPVAEPSAVIIVAPVEEEVTVSSPQPMEPNTVNVDLPTEETEIDTGLKLEPEGTVPDSTITDVTVIDSTASSEGDHSITESVESSPVSASNELVLVNDNVHDYEQLVADIEESDDQTRSIEVVILDDEEDGIDQVSAILAEYKDLDAIHIITHGRDGAFALGSDWVDSSSLTDNGDAVSTWADSLSEDADILLYGCNIAGDEDGRELTDTLAGLTGADIAASADMTGHAYLGADWQLEHEVGTIESSLPLSEQGTASWNNVLASLSVTTTNDVINGDTSSIANLIITPGADGISLREAIIAANNTAGADTITLAAGTYTLSIAGDSENLGLTGDLDITDDLTITGLGIGSSIIDGNLLNDRIFHVDSALGTVTISGVTIKGGDGRPGVDEGGGLYVQNGTVNLSQVLVTGNFAKTGGGISNADVLTLTDVTIDNNLSESIGGGLKATNATSTTLLNVTISNNVNESNRGGGVFNTGTLNATNATVSGNTTSSDGAGIYTAGNITLTNVTISGNTGGSEGGGLYVADTATLINVTITDNKALLGSGIFSKSAALAQLKNTIVAGNLDVADIFGSAGTFSSQGNNLIGDKGAVTDFVHGVNGDQVGTAASPVDPLLDVLADNGGSTLTHALLATSTAIDGGTNTGAPATDQRGVVRDATADIGAYEFVANSALVNTVPGSQTIDEDTTLVFNSTNGNLISISDPDVGIDIMETTISVNDGTLTLSGTTGLTFVSGSDGSGSMTIQGTLTDINTALDGLNYTPTLDYNGSDTLTIDTLDSELVTLNIDASLQGYYEFTNADPATDSSPAGTNSGSLEGNATIVTDGTRGEVLSLDGDGDYVEIASIFGQPADVTLAVWVNYSAIDTSGGEVISIGDAIVLRVDTGVEGVKGFYHDGSGWVGLNSGVDISDGAWHHIAYTVNDSTNEQALYIDGVSVLTGGMATSVDYGTGFSTTRIGAHPNNSAIYDFNGLIDDARIYDRALSASEIANLANDINLQDSDTVAITVTPINDAPSLSIIGDQTVDEGTELTFTATANDPDIPANTLTFSLDAASIALGMTITADGDFSWTPTEAQGGLTPDVTITVTDSGTGNLVDSEIFTITVGDINTAPVLAAIGNQTVDELATLSFTATATDSDLPADTLTFSLDAASEALGMTITADGDFSWTPTEAQGGLTPDVTITVTDSGTGNLFDSETLTITVNDVNTAPVLAAIGNQSIDELATLSFTATAMDTDLPADTLTFSLDAASITAGMTIDASSGAFSWTPTESQGGTIPSVTITVTDNGTGNLVDSETFTITVGDVNTPPVLAAIGNQSVDESATLSFTATAIDSDLPADTLTFSLDATSIAAGMTITAGGEFSWTPTEAQGGTTPSVTITVTDSGTSNLVDSETFTITVNDLNTAPVLNPIGNQTVDELTTLSFTATATDSDISADTLTFSLDTASIAAGMSITAGGDFTWIPTEAQGGLTPSVTITVTDSGTGNLIDSETFTISVVEINHSLGAVYDLNPASNSAFENASTGSVVGITAHAIDPDGTETVTYSLTNDSGGLFTIDANTGVISVAGGLDYETATSHTLTVRSQSTDGSFSEANFILQILDIYDSVSDNTPDTEPTGDSVTPPNDDTDPTVDNEDTVIVVPPVDDGLPDLYYENDELHDTSDIPVADFVPGNPETQEDPDVKTEKEDKAVPTSNPEDTNQAFDITNQKDTLLTSEPQTYIQLVSQTRESTNSVRPVHKENNGGALLKVVKMATKETLDFIAPPVSASPIYLESPDLGRSIMENGTMRAQLDTMHQDIDQAFERAEEEHKIVVYVANGISASFAVGAASYLLRAGSLMSSFLATVPIWKGFDPVAILVAPRKKRKKDEKTVHENESQSLTDTEQKAENMFAVEDSQ